MASTGKRGDALKVKQQAVHLGGASGLLTVVVSFAIVYYYQPSFLFPTPKDNRMDMMKWILPLVLHLTYRVAAIAHVRSKNAEYIDGSAYDSKMSEEMRIASAILQNTLEQTVIFALTNIVWMCMMPINTLCVIPVAVALFLCGRVFFARGYRDGSQGRAFGFALTFLPSAVQLTLETVSFFVGLVK
jgi:uncharacterized membrane protein YecN with MAPEG domain